MYLLQTTFLSRYDSLQPRGYTYDHDIQQAFREDITEQTSQWQADGIKGFLNSLGEVFSKLDDWLSTPQGQRTFLILGLVLLLFVLYKFQLLERLREFFVIQRNTRSDFDEPQVDTNIYRNDLEEKIAAAQVAKDYAALVHLYYLVALRHLVERKVLQWEKAYTPSDYVRHLQAQAYSHTVPMQRLTHIYLYTRFGHFAAYAETATTCETLLAQIQQKAKL